MRDFTEAESYFSEYQIKLNEERREKEEREAKRKNALSKLTEEEKALLNVR